MAPHKKVFTTGEVARICSVAPRTVSKWFDSGQLRGYRIPGSKDRRIPANHLLRFMRAHGMPMDGLETGSTRLLVVDQDTQFFEALAAKLGSYNGFEVTFANSTFEAGMIANETLPHALLLDIGLSDVKPLSVGRFVRSSSDLSDTCLIGTACGLTEAQGQELLQAGFDGYLAKPFEVQDLVKLIEQRTGYDAGPSR